MGLLARSKRNCLRAIPCQPTIKCSTLTSDPPLSVLLVGASAVNQNANRCFTGLLGSAQFLPAILFSLQFPEFLVLQLALSFAASVGQVIIYCTIKHFGAVFFSTVMTIRQVISILLSCIIFLHPLSILQWIAVFVVFGTLYYKAMAKTKKAATVSPAEVVSIPLQETATDPPLSPDNDSDDTVHLLPNEKSDSSNQESDEDRQSDVQEGK